MEPLSRKYVTLLLPALQGQAVDAREEALVIAQAFLPALHVVGGKVQQAERFLEFRALDNLRMLLGVGDEIGQRNAGGDALEARGNLGFVMMPHANDDLRGQFPPFQQGRADFGMGAAEEFFFARQGPSV